MNGSEFKREIERIFKAARNMCPNITDDMLDASGAIYYMNGNDSTSFDWNCNNRLCEFFMFHKNEIGFIKALVNRDNTVNVYIYEDGNLKPTCTFTEKMESLKASDFANLMNYIADDKKEWDKSIEELDWDFDTSECYDISEFDEDDEVENDV